MGKRWIKCAEEMEEMFRAYLAQDISIVGSRPNNFDQNVIELLLDGQWSGDEGYVLGTVTYDEDGNKILRLEEA